jgi:hypothetical protein
VGTNVKSFLGKCRILPALILVAGLAACFSDRDSTTGPSASSISGPSASFATTTGAKKVKGLLRRSPLKSEVRVSRTISSVAGGSIQLPGTDFELEIPPGAFEGRSLTFTVTAVPGRVIAYEFQPHGIVFKKPLTFSQRLSQANWDHSPFANTTQVRGAYFSDRSQLNLETGEAWVSEFFPATIRPGNRLTFPIPHFSGFMISTGLMEEEGF